MTFTRHFEKNLNYFFAVRNHTEKIIRLNLAQNFPDEKQHRHRKRAECDDL